METKNLALILTELKGLRVVKALDALGARAASFVDDAIAVPGDWVHLWRLINYQNVLSKAEMKLPGLVEPTPQLTIKCQLALTQAISEEEDSDLQELWANLIVNTVSGMSLDKYVVSVVSLLDRDEALLIEYVASAPPTTPHAMEVFLGRSDEERNQARSNAIDEIIENLHLTKERFRASLARLLALGLATQWNSIASAPPFELSPMGQHIALLTSPPKRREDGQP